MRQHSIVSTRGGRLAVVLTTTLFSMLFSGCAGSLPFEKVPYEKYRSQGGERMVRLSDGWTNYELTGDSQKGHPVVLIHGGTIPLCIWEAQVEKLRASGFRVLRYDQYGRGYSDRPEGSYSRDLFLRQLKELLDSLRINEPVTLLGPSFGGAIAVNFASHYPERVRAMVLVSPALNLLNSDSPLAGYIKLLRTPVVGISLYKLFVRSKLIRRGRSLVPGGIDSHCDTVFQHQFMCKGTEHSLFSMFKGDAYGNYREATKKAGASVKNILLLRGMEDKDITPKMIAEVREDLPSAHFVEIEKSGHNPGSDAAAKFNDIVVEFISKQ